MVISFRGFTAPASLKDVLPVDIGAGVPWFPGLYRPGLIEGHISLSVVDPRLCFRGFTAPASLKVRGV